eukprot:TRINITY_DN1276_c0_g1_i2.p1 TRINITY_DN1276_c0_g1~~TRINITY_DN1276_c0_g1_i2.p1  ORF type:complete len:108 (-),score=23.24 TRINITY_DN1276_c0_g1_i2:38-361(-)
MPGVWSFLKKSGWANASMFPVTLVCGIGCVYATYFSYVALYKNNLVMVNPNNDLQWTDGREYSRFVDQTRAHEEILEKSFYDEVLNPALKNMEKDGKLPEQLKSMLE